MQSPANFPSLRERSAVVTGGASGIGAALTAAFSAQGARTAFLDIDESAAAKTIAGIVAKGLPAPHFVQCDLTNPQALSSAFQAIAALIGPPRVLVNNAARDDRQDFSAVTPESWSRTLALNLDHVAFASQAVRAGMAAAGGGSIVNLSSNNVLMGAKGMAGYVTAKAGIVGLTKALARELGPDNIRVNLSLIHI